MKYVIGEMLKIFAPCIIIITVFVIGLIGTAVYRKGNLEKAKNFHKALSLSSKIIISLGGGFLMLGVISAVIMLFVFGIPAQQ